MLWNDAYYQLTLDVAITERLTQDALNRFKLAKIPND